MMQMIKVFFIWNTLLLQQLKSNLALYNLKTYFVHFDISRPTLCLFHPCRITKVNCWQLYCSLLMWGCPTVDISLCSQGSRELSSCRNVSMDYCIDYSIVALLQRGVWVPFCTWAWGWCLWGWSSPLWVWGRRWEDASVAAFPSMCVTASPLPFYMHKCSPNTSYMWNCSPLP